MEAKDILEDTETQDLKWTTGGDFTIGLSDSQHIKDIVFSSPNAWKQYPFCGVNITAYLNSSGTQNLLRKTIFDQLTTDGFGQVSVTFENNDVSEFNVNAVRN